MDTSILEGHDRLAEREKWDRYYADLPLREEDELARRFNTQLVSAVATFLKPGSRVLEAGCGGGWQSLALAHTQQYTVSLMDFSEHALGYARRVFEREQVPATFLAGDVLAPGEPAFDLVFNAGVLEHYTLAEQATFLRGMASRSRQYVLVLVPNRQCYWYWLWRIRAASNGQWPFGKEVPADDLSAAFAAAGLSVVGRAYLGEDWTESFINNLGEAAPELRDQILAVHRSPVIPQSQKSYLVAWLGVVPGAQPVRLPQWTVPGTEAEPQLPEALAALSDALALRIAAENRLGQLQADLSRLAHSTTELRLQWTLSEQAAQAAERTAGDLRAELAASGQAAQAAERTVGDLRLQLALSEQATQSAKQTVSELRTEVADSEQAAQTAQRTAGDLRLLLASSEQAAQAAEQAVSELRAEVAANAQTAQAAERTAGEFRSELAASAQAEKSLEQSSFNLTAQLADSRKHVLDLEQRLVESARQLNAAQSGLADKDGVIGTLENQLQAQGQSLAGLEAQAARLRDELAKVHGLKAWKLMAAYWGVVIALKSVLARPNKWFRQWLRRAIPLDVPQAAVPHLREAHPVEVQPPAAPEGIAFPAQVVPLAAAPDVREADPVEVQPPAAPQSIEYTLPDVPPAAAPDMRAADQAELQPPAAPRGVEYPFPRSFDVICFPIIDWEFRFQRPQQLMTQFVQAGHRGFYLRTTFQASNDSADVQPVAAGVFGVQLPGPSEFNLYRDQLAAPVMHLALQALGQLRDEAGIQDAVCLVQLPFWRPLALAARERWGWKIVYDCLDEHSGFGTMGPGMAVDEAELIEQSDLVLAASRSLYARVAEHARQALLIRNATDFEHFWRRPPVLPLAELRGPVIGYYGAIAEWFDVDMIRNAAVLRPEWHFVLIGQVTGADLRSVRPLPNVHLLGEQPFSELPGYLHRFAVVTIPFKRNVLTNATDPVKFYEYLSAGKPVVAVDLPELSPYRDYFYPVKSAADFVQQIEAALQEPAPKLADARAAFAQQNTWNHRLQAVLAPLAALYGKACVIVVSYNNLDYLRQCLDSVFAKTAYPNFEVIVVDNGSGPEVTAYLEQYAQTEPRLKVILNGANLGFARANNIAIRAAGPCDFVVLLNNDTIITPGWLSKLVGYLHNPQAGLVGPVTNNTGNEARIDVAYTSVDELDRFAADYVRGKDGLVFDIPMLAMYCVAMRRPLLDEIGLLDERFGTGLFEDDDFSLRVQRAGYRVICAEDIYVHHWQLSSFKLLEAAAYTELFEKNRGQFESKWARSWQPHRYRSQNLQLPPSARTSPTQVLWKCNICGAANQTRLADLQRENPSCPACESTVRTRAMVHLLSTELFNESLLLRDFPTRPDIQGLGLSDWEVYARPLSQKLSYINTYYHQEPRLDILAVHPALEASFDFLIATDVFEHVAPPISLAFQNARKLLKPTGFMVFSVPYHLGEATTKHFPELHDDTLEQREGALLEKRLFSKASIQRALASAGFGQVAFHHEPYFEYGVYWSHDFSVPLVARPA